MKLRGVVLLLTAAVWLGVEALYANEAEADLKRLDGYWTLAQGEEDGQRIADQARQDYHLMILDGQFTVYWGDTPRIGMLKLYPDQSPKAIDVTYQSGPLAGMTLQGIYKFEDQGRRFTVVIAPPGKERPKEFTIQSGTGELYHVWQREREFSQQAKEDMREFQGIWQLASATRDGKEVPQEEVRYSQIVLRGNMYVFPGTAAAGTSQIGMFMVDPSQSPKAIDVIAADGPYKGKVFPGIYKIEADRHTTCFALPGKDRPNEFTAPEGSQRMMGTWERIGQD